MHPKDNRKGKTFGRQTALLLASLYERNRPIFRLRHVQEILHMDESSSRSLVRKIVDKGIATRLKPGLFILVPFELGDEREYIGNPLVVAREVVEGKDYYLSHATAMEIHGMVTQPQLIIYVTTLKPRRPLNVFGTEIRFVRSQKRLFFGLRDHWVTKQERVRVSNVERTIIDGLRRPEYCGGLTEVAKGLYVRREDMDVRRLVEYALNMDKGAVTRRLGYMLELYKIGDSAHMQILQQHLTETYVRLDPILPSEGRFLRRWRLRLNISAEELLSVVST